MDSWSVTCVSTRPILCTILQVWYGEGAPACPPACLVLPAFPSVVRSSVLLLPILPRFLLMRDASSPHFALTLHSSLNFQPLPLPHAPCNPTPPLRGPIDSLIDPAARSINTASNHRQALALAPSSQPQPCSNLERRPSLHHTTYAETVVFLPQSLISAELGLLGFHDRSVSVSVSVSSVFNPFLSSINHGPLLVRVQVQLWKQFNYMLPFFLPFCC